MTYFRAILIVFSFVFTASYATGKESAPNAKATVPSATGADSDNKSESHDKHEHGKKCGHKSEVHGDHTDYEHEKDGHKHHHKKHASHYDECEGPEGESKAK